MVSTCLSDSNSLSSFTRFLAHQCLYVCNKSVTFILKTVSQNDKHKIIFRLGKDDRDQDLLFLSS